MCSMFLCQQNLVWQLRILQLQSENMTKFTQQYICIVLTGEEWVSFFLQKSSQGREFTLLSHLTQGCRTIYFRYGALQGASHYVRLAVAWNMENFIQEYLRFCCLGIFADLFTYSASAVPSLLTSPKILENILVRQSVLVQKSTVAIFRIG